MHFGKVSIKQGDKTFEVDGIICEKCGEAVLDQQQTQRLLLRNKLQKGIKEKIEELDENLLVNRWGT